MLDELYFLENDEFVNLELEPESRSFRLREMFWNKTHNKGVIHKDLLGTGDNTLVGYAKDFAVLLEASEPFIQNDELIVGCSLAIPRDKSSIDLGYYNRHYPPGHAKILQMGFTGIRDYAKKRLLTENSSEKRDFLSAVQISYDAACNYAEKYAVFAEQRAVSEAQQQRKDELEKIASICHELATKKPTSFHAALQLFWFTFIFGGRGCIGRFDQWLYPFYKADIEAGKITKQDAQELLECLWIKLNYFAERTGGTSNDSLRNIVVAGQTPDGKDGCNELTYMCLSASAKLMLPEPKLNVRFFKGSPKRLLMECCRVLAKGLSMPAIYNDEVVIPAMSKLGIPIEDARDYCNDGCSELIIGGKSTLNFQVFDSLPVLRETALNAENCRYETFEDVMEDFKSRLKRFMPEGHGTEIEVSFPYFAASIEDCLEKASTKGARYSIWGQILAEVGNSADGLAAIKKLIYEEKTITWEELISALKTDYENYETLRQMILNRASKYGNDDDYVDYIVKEIAEYFCDGVHKKAHNTLGYGNKRGAGLMCFGIHGKSDILATPDGRKRGDLIANSFSPEVGKDRNGPTAVLKSVGKINLKKASHGSVLDIAMHTSAFKEKEGLEKFCALIESFLNMPCTATLQTNVIDRDTLLDAQINPQSPEYKTLIVRVWGFSAVFVELNPELQKHVISRTEHGR